MANTLVESGNLSPSLDTIFFPSTQNSNFEYTYDSQLSSLSSLTVFPPPSPSPSPPLSVFRSDSVSPILEFSKSNFFSAQNQILSSFATLPSLEDPFADLTAVHPSLPPPASPSPSTSSSFHSLPPPSRLFTSHSLPSGSSRPSLLPSRSLPSPSAPSLSSHPLPLSPSGLSPSLPPPKRLKIADLAPKLSLLSSDVLRQLLAPSGDSNIDLSFLTPPGGFSRDASFPGATPSVNANNNLSFPKSPLEETDKNVLPSALDTKRDLSFLAPSIGTSKWNLLNLIQSGETKGNLSFLAHSGKNSRDLSPGTSALLSLLSSERKTFSTDSNCPIVEQILESRLKRNASQKDTCHQNLSSLSELSSNFQERSFSRNQSQIRVSELGKRQNPVFPSASVSNCSSVASWKKDETSSKQNNKMLSSKRPFSDFNFEGNAVLISPLTLSPLSSKDSQSTRISETAQNPKGDPSLFSFLVSDWPKLVSVSQPQTSQNIHQQEKMRKRPLPMVGNESDSTISFSESPRGHLEPKFSPTSSEILKTFESCPDVWDTSMSNSMSNPVLNPMSNSMPNTMLNPMSNLNSNSLLNTDSNWNTFASEMEGTLAGMVMQQMTPKGAKGDLKSQQIWNSVNSECFEKREDLVDMHFDNIRALFRKRSSS